jgi:hypothetical protein
LIWVRAFGKFSQTTGEGINVGGLAIACGPVLSDVAIIHRSGRR